MDWDPSRDYDSRTFSDDYNLHGASARSFDHPSVTRDDDFFAQEDLNDHDDYSIENADLIADIVDGKTTQDYRARITTEGHIHAMAHKTDDNSGRDSEVTSKGARSGIVYSSSSNSIELLALSRLDCTVHVEWATGSRGLSRWRAVPVQR